MGNLSQKAAIVHREKGMELSQIAEQCLCAAIYTLSNVFMSSNSILIAYIKICEGGHVGGMALIRYLLPGGWYPGIYLCPTAELFEAATANEYR